MTKEKETVQERLERMKREKEEAAARSGGDNTALVSQLTHEDDGEPDFAQIAQKLEQRKELEPKGENAGYVKMTIYIEENLAKSFDALCTKHGQKKVYANQALKDFVIKKARELDLDK